MVSRLESLRRVRCEQFADIFTFFLEQISLEIGKSILQRGIADIHLVSLEEVGNICGDNLRVG